MIPYDIRPLGPWPNPRQGRERARFKATWTDTLTLIGYEISRIGGRRFVLQLDVSERWIRNDGQLYARAVTGSPAVRVSFESMHGPLMYATDRYDNWQDNIRAIALSLAALRAVDRYGVSSRGEQYRGWTAIDSKPAQITPRQAAQFIVQCAGLSNADDSHWPHNAGQLIDLYRVAARRAHPDQGGDHDTMAKLNVARDIVARALLEGAAV